VEGVASSDAEEMVGETMEGVASSHAKEMTGETVEGVISGARCSVMIPHGSNEVTEENCSTIEEGWTVTTL